MVDHNPPQNIEHVDVLVVGGGPVGLITAYQLASSLPPTYCIKIIEKHPKSAQDQYGRAITLYPRSVEMLDQLGLADALAQECFACRTTVSYDKDGREVAGRGWYFMEGMKDTNFDFALVLRQKHQEEIFRQALGRKGVTLETSVALIEVTVAEGDWNSYRISATLEDVNSSTRRLVKCKYLVGADGGRSFVRRALQVPFEGTNSEDKWVRIDGIVETDMPKPRSYCAIESPTHGNVLWAALDHGGTRIGFAFTAERQKAYPIFDEAAAVKEAIASVKPFSLSFKQVDWYTIYVVGQRVARHFFVKDCIFLAGDACHTHSSGAAQGMNTGLHDAVNLGWKLSLVLRGLAKPRLLYTYEAERLPNVQKLIDYDKDISRLMTMQLPLGWTGDPNADPNEVLGTIMAKAATFSSGLGICYEKDDVLSVPRSFRDRSESSKIESGQRAPDVTLEKPGSFERTRLQKETPNLACFYAIIFSGDLAFTSSEYLQFSYALNSSVYLTKKTVPLSWLTITNKSGPSAYELLGMMPIGNVFYDTMGSAHARYDVDVRKGGIFVVRPDGWVGTATELHENAITEIERYFFTFLDI